MKYSVSDVHALCTEAFAACKVTSAQAGPTIDALILAEAQGLASHGISRVPMYLAHVTHGRINPNAVPVIQQQSASAALINADNGFAFPACNQAIKLAIQKASETGIAVGAVTNSHHFGVAGNHLRAIADAGLVGWAMGNSPAAMPAWGGKRAIFGTNPIAAIFPRTNADPILVDLSLSEVARGKIMVAAKNGTPIPQGWALDAKGNPTTDAKAALAGMMLPMGGVKGAMLAMVVEIMVTALTGAHFGAEADSFFIDAGNQPRLGQLFLVINPDALAGRLAYESRLSALIDVVLQDPDVRLPGTRRFALAEEAMREGLELPDALVEQIRKLA